MNTSADVQTLLDGELGSILRVLEAERLKTLRKVNTAMAIGVVLILACVTGFFGFKTGLPFIFILIFCGGGAALCFYIASNATSSYCRFFKLMVHGRLVRLIDDGLEYSATGSISAHEFEDSQLFPRRHDRFRGEDLVQGRIGQTTLKFSEVHAEYRSRSADNKNDQWHTIFRGLFFIADFNKHFVGQTIVTPDQLTAPLGKFIGHTLQSLGARLNSRRGELVKLEDPEFEKSFVVYSTDQIEARYLLSNSLMRRILNFQQKTGRPLHLAFVTTNIYVAIPCGKNMFEPSIYRSALSPAPLEEYLNDMQLMTGLVHDLDLNTRIWSKQPTAA